MKATQRELLEVVYELETTGEYKSLFQVAALAVMDYAWGWHVLGQLEAAGLVTVERNGAPWPLKVSMTEKGRMAVLERRQAHQEGLWEPF